MSSDSHIMRETFWRRGRRGYMAAKNGLHVSMAMLWAALMPFATPAQQPAAAPASSTLKLSLKEAAQLGLKQNPQRINAALLTAESKRNSDIARSSLLPQAALTADGA